MTNNQSSYPLIRLGICAPGARFDKTQFQRAGQVLSAMGFDLEVPEAIFEKQRYLAGTDQQRAEVLNGLFRNPSIDAVLCARGGFGSMRVLDHLNWDLIAQNPKPVVGYSDMTALLLTLSQRAGCPVIHGPHLVSFADADLKTIDSFKRVMGAEPDDALIYEGQTALIPGSAEGTIYGGNLTTIAHLAGTPYMPVFDDGILFIEEVNEPAYRIDRMLTQLQMAGCFRRIRGVVTGSFEQCDYPGYIDQILKEVFGGLQIPVLTGIQCGHGPVNRSLPMGITAAIKGTRLIVGQGTGKRHAFTD